MQKKKTGKKRNSYLAALFNLQCPRCRQARLFPIRNPYRLKHTLVMHDHCPGCGQKTEIETGFYVGTGYVSYALTVAFSVTTFVAWCILVGISIYDNRIFWWLGLNALLMVALQPYFMRLSRIIWLSFFTRHDKNWHEKQQP